MGVPKTNNADTGCNHNVQKEASPCLTREG